MTPYDLESILLGLVLKYGTETDLENWDILWDVLLTEWVSSPDSVRGKLCGDILAFMRQLKPQEIVTIWATEKVGFKYENDRVYQTLDEGNTWKVLPKFEFKPSSKDDPWNISIGKQNEE